MIETIQIFENVIPDNICDEIVSRYEGLETSFIFKAKVHKGDDLKYRNNDILYILDNPELEKEDSRFVGLVSDYLLNKIYNDAVVPYNKSMSGAFDGLPFWTIDELDLLKYYKNEGFYKEHIDSDGVNANRYFSILVYLNDVETGGETSFPLQDKTIKPKRGSVAIFPSDWTHPHIGCMPTSNDKYVIVCWAVPDLSKIDK
jgi:hypothetical protein